MEFQKFRSKLSKEDELEYMKGSSYRFNQTFRRLPSSSNSLKILDIGTTPFTFFIKEAYPHYKVATLDLTNLLQARCEVRDIEFKRCDLAREPIPFQDNYFDVVIFTEVLEHLFTPPTKVLREIWRVICGGGVIDL